MSSTEQSSDNFLPLSTRTTVQRSFLLILGLVVPLLLAVMAVPRMMSGFGEEVALPVVINVALEDRQDLKIYRQAAAALKPTMPSNGDGLIREAEMVALGANGHVGALQQAKALTIAGLRLSPANARGWTLLCEIETVLNRPSAARCMDTGFFIAPFDWFTARRRAVMAAYLWPYLGPDVKKAAARRVRQMWDSDVWSDHRVKEAIFDVYMTPNGPALLKAGFSDDKTALRALNVWLIHKRMYPSKPS